MGGSYDGEVVINTKLDNSQALSGTEDLSKAMQDLANMVSQVGETLKNIMRGMAGGFNEVNDQLTTLNESMSQAAGSGNRVQQVMVRTGEEAATMGSRIADMAKNWLYATNTSAKFGASAGHAIKSVYGYAQRVKASIQGTKDQISGAADNMLQMAKRTAMMMLGVRGMYMLVRKAMSAFTTGAKQLALVNDSFNQAMSNITNSMNQLKYNVAAVFAPIIERLEPIITALFDKINAGLNKIAEFMAALTGKGTYQKAIKQANSYAKASDKAAKSTQNSLNALEELNVIGRDEESASDTAGAFYETAAVNEKFKTIAEYWKKLFTSGDYRKIGEALGDLVNRVVKIDWDTISKKLRKVGSGVADFANGFIQSGALSTIGDALGNWENQVGYLFGGFFDKFEWAKNGKSIGEALNAYMGPTDWEQFRHNALAFWGGLATMLNEIIETDGLWENIGTTIAGKILVAIDSWWSFVTNFHFDSFGEGIGKAINQFFDDMGAINEETGKNGWEELGESIFKTADGLVVALSKALETTDWTQIGDAIGTLFASIDWIKFIEDFGKCAWNLLKAIAQGFSAWAEKDPISAAIVGILGANMVLSKFSMVGGQIGGSLLSGLGAKLGVVAAAGVGGFALGKWLGKLFWPDDADLYDDLNLETVCEAIVTLTDRIGEKFQALFDTVSGWVSNIGEKIADFADYTSTALLGDDKSNADSFLGWILDGMPEEAEPVSGGGYSGGGASFGGETTSGLTFAQRRRKIMRGAANGAVIPRTATEHFIKVGDNKAETEIVSPLSTMKQALTEALAESAQNSSGEQHITLNIDGQALFDWVVKKNRENYIQTHQNQLVY